MPQIAVIYPLATYRTVNDLKDWMIRANAYGNVTRNQGKAIVEKLTPLLPVDAELSFRTAKKVIYMRANGTRFSLSPRGVINPKPWNPNPRQPAPNPWLD